MEALTMAAKLPLDARPKLARGVRLREDSTRGGFVLLAPERVLNASPTAVEVLKRCDGKSSLSAIIDDLAARYSADRDRIGADVDALLSDLVDKRMVEL
jgi:pyrroloquinoline quinone biosynthesis protein D